MGVLKLIQFNIHSKLKPEFKINIHFLKSLEYSFKKIVFLKSRIFIQKKYSFSLKEAVSPTPIRGPSYFFTKVTAKLTDLFLLLKSPLVINSIKYRFVLGKQSKNW